MAPDMTELIDDPIVAEEISPPAEAQPEPPRQPLRERIISRIIRRPRNWLDAPWTNERIARYLLNLSDSSLGGRHTSGQPFVRATHELIAEGTGATRESVSKLIGEMRDDGLLSPAYRCITLTGEQDLRVLAGLA